MEPTLFKEISCVDLIKSTQKLLTKENIMQNKKSFLIIGSLLIGSTLFFAFVIKKMIVKINNTPKIQPKEDIFSLEERCVEEKRLKKEVNSLREKLAKVKNELFAKEDALMREKRYSEASDVINEELDIQLDKMVTLYDRSTKAQDDFKKKMKDVIEAWENSNAIHCLLQTAAHEIEERIIELEDEKWKNKSQDHKELELLERD